MKFACAHLHDRAAVGGARLHGAFGDVEEFVQDFFNVVAFVVGNVLVFIDGVAALGFQLFQGGDGLVDVLLRVFAAEAHRDGSVGHNEAGIVRMHVGHLRKLFVELRTGYSGHGEVQVGVFGRRDRFSSRW